MLDHRVGIHLANGQDDHGSRIGIIENGCYTLLHHEINEIKNIPAGALILIRYYIANWSTIDPIEWADKCAATYQTHKNYTRHCTWANEQNLADESGGVIGATSWGRRATRVDYEIIAAWNYAFIRRFLELCPDAILHYPAMAAGHSDDQDDYGFVGLNICRAGVELCDVLDVHCYPTLGKPVNNLHLGAARVHLNHNLFPNKPLFISECGNFRVMESATPIHYEEMCWYWNQYPWILGWTFFIAADPTKAHGQNDMSKNPNILDTLGRVARTNLLERPAFAPIITAPEDTVSVGQGFNKAKPFIGNFLEDEIYHFPGSYHEVSAAVGELGVAFWIKATNETVIYRLDKSIYVDGGNDGDGRFRKVR